MRMGSDYDAYFSIQKSAHRNFLAGGFRMQIHQDNIRLLPQARNFRFRRAENGQSVLGHEHATDKIDHPDWRQPVPLHHRRSPAGS